MDPDFVTEEVKNELVFEDAIGKFGKNFKAKFIGCGEIRFPKEAEEDGLRGILCEWYRSTSEGASLGIVSFRMFHGAGLFVLLDRLEERCRKLGFKESTKVLQVLNKEKPKITDSTLTNITRNAAFNAAVGAIDSSQSLMIEFADIRTCTYCKICFDPLMPDDEVATLVNLENSALACSSSTADDGRFHVFHVECLIRWIMLCEHKRMCGLNTVDITSVYCPVCQGTGVRVQTDESRWVYKQCIEILEAQEAWMRYSKPQNETTVAVAVPSKSGEDYSWASSYYKKIGFYRAEWNHPVGSGVLSQTCPWYRLL